MELSYLSLSLIPIEAGSTATVTARGNYTFYGHLNDFDASDNREPLATAWAGRFDDRGLSKAWFHVWREPQAEALGSRIVAHDEDGLPEALPDEPYFPNVTQQVRLGADLPTPYDRGWLSLQPGDGPRLQSVVVVRQDFRKRRSLHPATLFYDAAAGRADVSACGPAPAL